MWQYLITPLLVIIIFMGLAWAKFLIKSNQELYTERHYSQCIADGKLEREEIKQLLRNLPASADWELDKIGAMCYKSAGPPKRAEYSCPTCGAKTLYILEKDNDSYKLTIFLKWGLDQSRRLISEIKGIQVELDERQFCKKCSPNVKSPELALNIKLPGETDSHHVKITEEDIKLLIEFTQGEITHEYRSWFEGETMLKMHKNDLERLLGISTDEK
jgi:hypothetical protein